MVEHRIKRDIRHAGYIAGVRLVGIPAVGNDGRPVLVSTYPITVPVTVRMVWSVPTKHRRDADSAQPSLKSYQDGLVDAGVLAGDHWEIVRKSYCEIEYCPNQPMSVRVEIAPMERKDTTT
jgi:hypothetical protein